MTTPMTTRLGLILQTNAAGCFVDFVRPLPCSSFETRHCSLKTRKRIVPGSYNVFEDLGLRVPNIQIDIDQDRANSLRLNNQQIGNVAQASFTGLKVTELREGDRLIPVLIRGRSEGRSRQKRFAPSMSRLRSGRAFHLTVLQTSSCSASSSRSLTRTSSARRQSKPTCLSASSLQRYWIGRALRWLTSNWYRVTK